MIPFNFHHLYYFYVTASEGSFTKAAKKLRVSQPALSIQIKQFQQYWNMRLFSKDRRGIKLTEQGTLIFNYAKTIFDLGQELSDNLTSGALRGKLKLHLGVSVAVPRAVVQALLRHIYLTFPEIHLVLKQEKIEDMIDALTAHKLDLVMNDFAYETDLDDGLQNYLTATIPMVFCASRATASKFKNAPKDLDNAPLILPTAPDRTYHAVQNYIHINKIKPNIIAEVQDLEQARMLVAMGKGVGLLNSYAVKHSPEQKDLIVLHDKSKHKINDTIYLIRKERQIPHPVIDSILRNFKIKL